MQLVASGVKLKASIGASSAPLETVRGITPGHAIVEHLDPALVSFATMSNGQLCGNASAAALAAAPVAQSLQSGGNIACDEGYGASNTMLDVLVGGCSKFELFTTIVIIAPTQPDQVDADAPKAGAGGPYKLGMSGGKVSSCKDKGGAVVDLNTCLNAAAYSSFLTFTTDRVILK